MNTVLTFLVLFISFSSQAKINLGIFTAPLSLSSGGRGGAELYLGKHWALGAEYSFQNTIVDDSTPYDPYHFFMPTVQGGDISVNYGPRVSYYFKDFDKKSFYLLSKFLQSRSEVLYANGAVNYIQDASIGIFIIGYSYPTKRWFFRFNLGAGAYTSEINRKGSQGNPVSVDMPPAFVFADFESGILF